MVSRATLSGPKSLEALLYDSRVLTMVIRVHLHVRCRYVYFVAILMDAMIVRLLSIVRTSTARVLFRTIVHWWVPHETVLQGLVPLLMPLEVPDHFLLLHKHSPATVQTMKMLPAAQFFAVRTAAFLTGCISPYISGIIDDRLGHWSLGTTHQRIRYRRHTLPEQGCDKRGRILFIKLNRLLSRRTRKHKKKIKSNKRGYFDNECPFLFTLKYNFNLMHNTLY